MTAGNYDHSAVKSATVCVMSDSAAIVSAQFVRYRTDGTTLNEGNAALAALPDGTTLPAPAPRTRWYCERAATVEPGSSGRQ